jgi:two-component system, chemotaxis family, protein-glutamate methylesterase/glutaminase
VPTNDELRHVHTFVVGASAGGIEALRTLVAQLPSDFPGVLLVVLHVPPAGTSVLPQILERAGEIPACHPDDGEPMEPGRIYVAPPNRHLLVDRGRLALDVGPKVHGHRPAIDALFRSAAKAFGREAAGIILSGVLDDGTAGLIAIKRAGGLTMVQDPEDALYRMMPVSAIDVVGPDIVGTASELGRIVARLAEGPPPEQPAAVRAVSDHFSEIDRGASDDPQPGTPTGLTCPECQGGLWETLENGRARYRCRVGHEYGQESFVAAQADRVEMALWSALRALEERGALHRRIAMRQRERGREDFAERYQWRADEAVEQALVLRGVLTRMRDDAEEEVREEGAA